MKRFRPLLFIILAEMSNDHGDVLWEAFVTAMLAAGPVAERRSRYGDKPALFTASREIAHMEAPGVIDLRITRVLSGATLVVLRGGGGVWS